MKKILIWNQHWILDTQLRRPVRQAIQRLTESGEETIFYFLARTEFTALCLAQIRSVQRATGRPLSTVYLAVTECTPCADAFFRKIDRVEYPFGARSPQGDNRLLAGQRTAVEIWVLRQCDALLGYFYPAMARSEWNRITAARNRPPEIVNLIRPATEEKIVDYMQLLPADQRLVFDSYRIGKTTRQINADLGGTYPSRIYFLYARAVFTIGRRFQTAIQAEKHRHRDEGVPST